MKNARGRGKRERLIAKCKLQISKCKLEEKCKDPAGHRLRTCATKKGACGGKAHCKVQIANFKM
jgi:hypothetical protein